MAIIENPNQFDGECIVLREKDIILSENGALLSFAELLELKECCGAADFFAEKEWGYCVLEIQDSTAIPHRFALKTIRQFYAENSDELKCKVSRAKALVNWRKNMKFCPKCGAPLQNSVAFSAKECPDCKAIHFPRIEPCIIVLVSKGNKILLARHVQRNQDIYACIAGFMEAGETAEQAVRREIFEETGLRVKDITYRGSQSWPFPSQLMLGFTAEYESGELSLQKDEIADARWFDRDNCPATPQPGSIAYRLIRGEW